MLDFSGFIMLHLQAPSHSCINRAHQDLSLFLNCACGWNIWSLRQSLRRPVCVRVHACVCISLCVTRLLFNPHEGFKWNTIMRGLETLVFAHAFCWILHEGRTVIAPAFGFDSNLETCWWSFAARGTADKTKHSISEGRCPPHPKRQTQTSITAQSLVSDRNRPTEYKSCDVCFSNYPGWARFL